MNVKILVIEDDPMILRTLVFRLQKDGYEVVQAKDGKEGMELLQQESFQLVITDLMLPYFTGLEIVSFVQQQLHIPVIVLTSADQEATAMEAFQLGAADFIPKPFSPGELSVRVKRLIQLPDRA